MVPTAVIAFREFLEAFLIVGVFLGISRKLNLKKEKEILLASALGIFLSLLLSAGTYAFGDRARLVLTEKNADFLESYLLIFSGLFISYVVFSLHKVLRKARGSSILTAHKKLQSNAFDMSLFFTIVFMVLREGFEIALFTASVSLFSAFMQNMIGLMLGFGVAIALGVATFFAYVRFPIGKVFKYTEYMIILLGASLTQLGITKLFETHFKIQLSNMWSFHLGFLPDESTIAGHVIKSFFGVDRDFSAMRFGLMIAYCVGIYLFFIKLRKSGQEKMP